MTQLEDTKRVCVRCQEVLDPALREAGESDQVCTLCRQHYPPSLLKATVDCFDYALKLRTGEILYFASATISGDYATLESQDPFSASNPCPRGIDVRVDQIVWCADAPKGS
jgi:hypothetical protein